MEPLVFSITPLTATSPQEEWEAADKALEAFVDRCISEAENWVSYTNVSSAEMVEDQVAKFVTDGGDVREDVVARHFFACLHHHVGAADLKETFLLLAGANLVPDELVPDISKEDLARLKARANEVHH